MKSKKAMVLKKTPWSKPTFTVKELTLHSLLGENGWLDLSSSFVKSVRAAT